MKRKEIVVLDSGVEMREVDGGVLVNSYDMGFRIGDDEIIELIQYFNNHLSKLSVKVTGPEYPGKAWAGEAQAAPVREMTPAEKAARVGVTAAPLMPPSAAGGMKGRVVPAQSVSVHNS